MKVQILSSFESSGGAARAANRLHKALVEQGIDSTMRVRTKSSDDWRVVGPRRPVDRLKADINSILETLPTLLQMSVNPILHSPGWISGVKASEINGYGADVVNLHWVCDALISVAQIGRITRPVVWTLHDSWTFCGMEHHPLNDEDLRFKQGYSKHNRPEYLKGLDVDRWAWKRKKHHFSQSMHLIAPSNWLADKARQSAIAGDWPVTVVPNPLDTNTFKPIGKSLARTILNLPRDKKIVLVGAFGSVMNKNKGFDLLAGALHKLSLTETELKSGIHLVVFGQNQPVEPVVIPFPVTFMGHLSDDYSLSLLYNASDVVVVPSRMENLPQTATEAQACGIPVAAFDVCGIPDAVDHERTGFLAKGYDTDELAKGIAWILEDQDRYHQLSALARAKALSAWAPQLVVDRYLDAYRQAIDHHKSQSLQ